MVKSIVLVLAFTSVAHADDTVDPQTAQKLSIIGSAVPIAAIGLGTFVGYEGTNAPIRDIGTATALTGTLVGVIAPSLGAIYSHHAGTGGLAMRVGGLIIGYNGLVKYASTDVGDCEVLAGCHHPASTYVLLASGAGMYFGGMALDIAHAPDFARKYNLQVVPTAIRSPSATSTGLAIAGRF